MVYVTLSEFLFNDTLTIVGHFVLSSREMEKGEKKSL